MNQNSFSKKVYGKCILVGEHAVIRGSPALVYPVREKFLDVSFENSFQEFSGEFEGQMKEDLSLVFWGVLEKALKIINKKHSDLHGKLKINNQVPVGAGLGASATLCVALGRFFQYMEFVAEEELYEFCRQLENLFHGESSGVDIASTLTGEPIQFQRPHQIEKLNLQNAKWRPNLYLTYSGQRGSTAECVRMVKELFLKDEKLALQIDEQMKSSVLQMREGLFKTDGLKDCTESILRAQACFVQWGLTQGALDTEMERLKSFGALATKPTGSGRGGYVLSLWKDTPPTELLKDMIRI